MIKSNIAALLNNENVSLDTICGLASTIDDETIVVHMLQVCFVFQD